MPARAASPAPALAAAPALAVALLLVVVGSSPAVAGAAARWVAPVGGDVVRGFSYDRGAPFVRGAHRGVDLAAPAGSRVAAPCSGAVVFAGDVPRFGRGVTIRCGALRATVLGLRQTRVRRGARVGRGAPLGEARGGTVQLGARRADDPFGYVDPRPLLASSRRPAAPWVAPPPAPTRPTPRALPPRLEPTAAPADTTPVLAWVGLGLLGAAVPVGALVRRRARRRITAPVAYGAPR